ncbi:carboxylesterase/lipase family protein [Sphingobium sp. YR768]|uniref:carboxylesterase/lipase family protein n=1 Tax=Sphingobium sp. YR768 TaxID=1884365 RepID=UPI0008B6FF5C|nr:carboxylesterase family protein [Sphingobium sp. YR768]SER43846.1 para-nitrobenzyl esterase [Sphingobium sp. YR768]
MSKSTRLLVLALALYSTPSLAAPDAPEVTIGDGALRGVAAEGVVAFKGIPFAAPPVGDLRWRAPQPVAHWQGVRDASRYGHDCMQLPFPSDAAPLGTPPAEDCLFVNVWKPEAAKGKLPVMVWIYGGGFVNGGSSPPTYAGDALARQGIMVVSFNYRLGRFGTFAHPALTKADADKGLLANYGYMDQIAALRWVQANITAFGGDPANVTIIGESAGGMSVHALLTSPMAQGLFSKAVIQSGGPMPMGDATLAGAEALGAAFGAKKGVAADSPDALAKLRALPANDIVDGLNLAALFSGAPRDHSSPIADGRIAVDSLGAYQAGHFAKVPVMVGATSDDIGGPSGPMVAGARTMADQFVAQGVPTYYYRFSYVAASARTAETKGAGHASEIPYFFDTVGIKYGAATTAADRSIGRISSGYLVNFVKNGNPNGTGLPVWQRHDAAGQPMLDIGPDDSAASGPDNWASGASKTRQ